MIAEVEVDGEPHLVKLSRYHDNQQFWTVPGERDERLHRRGRSPSPSPSPTSTSSTTSPSIPTRNGTSPIARHADERSGELQAKMLTLLIDQLAQKRLVPSRGEVPGYRAPLIA